MTHDPLCPLPDIYECQCNLIDKVRADEREQAGMRVAALTHWVYGWPENVVVSRSSAIDAAEGGDGE